MPLSLLFGSAGIPLSTPKPDTLTGIQHVRKLGLDAMELEFVRSVHVSEEKAPLVKEAAKRNNVTLTCHGQYFVNLNAQTEKTLQESVRRILEASRRAHQAGAWSICYHMAYYMKDDPEKVFQKVKVQAKKIVQQLKNEGNAIWLRPETGGKIAQFGDIDALVKLSQEVEQVLPCIDWAHHYARSLGKVNSYEQFAEILAKIEKGLGRQALDNMHMHLEGIAYTDKGERNHLTVAECDFKYKEVLRALKDFKCKGVLISESPNVEEDGLLFKKTFEKL
ncbi:TIM barrel protein [Candidatus Woesearchaeota archaeon]|nr:TIM barrel protein [Candidatus Woesearchaeota archaeon]